VYNDEYLLHDPDFELTRPQNMVHFMGEVFGDLKSSAVHLDYGGGKGTLAALMRDNGWNSSSYDPFYDTGSSVGGPYNIVSMFEVVEHHPDPIALFDSVRALLEPYGLIVFSTLLSDNYVSHSIPGGEDWWYAKPRVGHVMLHSKDSVRHIARRLGFGLKMIEDRGCVMGNFYSEIE
jgi:SAM-dependent methyltransferase